MIIGISGYIGSGKDTVAQIIQYLVDWKRLGFPSADHAEVFLNDHSRYDKPTWEIKKFAGKLKQMVSLLTGIPVADLEKPEVKNSELGEEWNKIMIEQYFDGSIGDFIKFMNEDSNRIVSNKDSYIIGETKRYFYFDKVKKLTVRELLQKLGTEAVRDVIHPNAWVNALFADYVQNVYWMCDRCDSDNLLNLIEIPTRFPEYPENEWVCPKCKGAEEEGDITKVIPDNPSNWIISDMRFPNEMEAVKARNGITVRINRYSTIMVAKQGSVTTANEYLEEVQFDPSNPEHINMHKGWISKLHPSETSLDNSDFDYYINNNGTIPELIDKVREMLLNCKLI